MESWGFFWGFSTCSFLPFRQGMTVDVLIDCHFTNGIMIDCLINKTIMRIPVMNGNETMRYQ